MSSIKTPCGNYFPSKIRRSMVFHNNLLCILGCTEHFVWYKTHNLDIIVYIAPSIWNKQNFRLLFILRLRTLVYTEVYKNVRSYLSWWPYFLPDCMIVDWVPTTNIQNWTKCKGLLNKLRIVSFGEKSEGKRNQRNYSLLTNKIKKRQE